jgi:ATP-dependent Lon protease
MATNSDRTPILPLRDIVLYPGVIAPLFVGRQKSITAIENVMKTGKKIVLLTQKDATKDFIEEKDLYEYGIQASILQMLKLPDGTVKLLVEGKTRVKINSFQDDDGFFSVTYQEVYEIDGDKFEIEALSRSLMNEFKEYGNLNKKINPEILTSIHEIKDAGRLADTIISHILVPIEKKQEILEELSIISRLEKVIDIIKNELGVLDAERKIKMRVKKQMEKTQKDYYLSEQMKAIQKEMGEVDDIKSEIKDFEEKIDKIKLSLEAKEKLQAEIKKLKLINSASAEASIVRNYIDTLINLPWGLKGKIKRDLAAAQKQLDNDHYGLEKVKERILEYLAVQVRKTKMEGPILCLVGPPGVGKTSLASSIAEATGRKFVKFSLGGMRDEAEIRGHRRTYVGAMPGKIIQLIKKAKTSNPLMLLDEVDKLGNDFRGDPSSALLEVLDPEQNDKFSDHYLEVEFDLSNVFFVATANNIENIPRPLLDRMEIIRLSGYTEDEKVNIGIKYLLNKQIKAHGIAKGELSASEDVIRDIIRYYTREAGVRSLEKEIAKICRKVVKRIIEKKTDSVELNTENLSDYLGVRKYDFSRIEEKDLVGVSQGLAYSEVGGDLLAIETLVLPGKGNIKTTGKLGDIMQESAQAAFSYFKSRSIDYGIIPPEFMKRDLHIHVPEGAIPKDGPSAGIALFTSIVSAMTGIPVRRSVAMTGEITLRGRVLPIGGLKEKLLAALRGGIKTVLIPQDNKKDLSEMPKNIIENLKIICVSNVDEVIAHALSSAPKAVKWSEVTPLERISGENGENDILTH